MDDLQPRLVVQSEATTGMETKSEANLEANLEADLEVDLVPITSSGQER